MIHVHDTVSGKKYSFHDFGHCAFTAFSVLWVLVELCLKQMPYFTFSWILERVKFDTCSIFTLKLTLTFAMFFFSSTNNTSQIS